MREHGGGMERCPVGIFCSAPFSPGFLRGWPFIGCRKRRPVHPSGGMFPSIFWCFWFCGPSVSISFSDRRKGSGGICGTPLAGQPPEAAALRHSGGLGPVAASFPVLSRAGVRRIGNGIFRDTGGAALVPEKESPFGIGACPRRARDAAIGSIRPPLSEFLRFYGRMQRRYIRSTLRARAAFLAKTRGFSTDSK